MQFKSNEEYSAKVLFPKFVAGIDVGARNTKAVVLGEGQFFWAVLNNGPQAGGAVAERAFQYALRNANVNSNDIEHVIATGQGKRFVTLTSDTELDSVCLAKGIDFFFSSAQTVVDIGARKCLAVKCCKGRALGTMANDRCAAGTGLYIEKLADILCTPLDETGDLSLKSKERLEIVSTCGVFIESEVISLIHSKKRPEDILKAIFAGIAERITPLLAMLGLEKDVAVAGGVARNKGVVKAMEEAIGCEILVPENPEIVAALGAALVAKEKVK